MSFLMNLTRALRAPIIGILLALIICCLLLSSLGESPIVLIEALSNTLGTGFGLGYSLFYATPLIFTGLSVAMSFHCGLFNIGAEGQLYLGAATVIAVSHLFPDLPYWAALPVGIVASLIGGGLLGGFVGFLKAKRGSHEVIVTIVMNFIAISFTNYLILYPFKNQEVQNPETFEIGKGYYLRPLYDFFQTMGLEFFKSTPVNTTLFLALVASVLCYVFLFHTTYGYEMRTVGANPKSARFAGISVSKNMFLAFAISGALAGLVGVNEVMGYQHKLVEGFSPEYGFTGIAVALMARNNPLGVILSAFLFGALQNSSRELEFISEKVTKELSLVLQATLIAFIASQYVFEKWLAQRKNKKVSPPTQAGGKHA